MQPNSLQKPPILVGFAGKAGAGKTSIAHALARRLKERPQTSTCVRSFADAVRDELRDLYFGRPLNSPPSLKAKTIAAAIGQYYLTLRKKDITELLYIKPPAPLVRWLLQWWGTSYRRAQDPNYWVTAFFTKSRLFLPPVKNRFILIDDVRFPNEVEAIRRHNGSIFWVHNPAPVRFLTGKQARHPSENSLHPYYCDFTVTTDPRTETSADTANKILPIVLSFEPRCQTPSSAGSAPVVLSTAAPEVSQTSNVELCPTDELPPSKQLSFAFNEKGIECQ